MQKLLTMLSPNHAAAHTHRLHIDILMKDFTVRDIDLSFNGWEEYQESGVSPLETSNLFYRLLIKGLDKDKSILGWRGSIVHLETGKKVTEYDAWVKTALQ